MVHSTNRRRRMTAVCLAAAGAALILLPGCLPPLSPSGEPLAPVPSYVTSVKIDPRTLEPVDEKDEKTVDKKTEGDKPEVPAPE